MRLRALRAYATAITVIVLGAASTAQGQVVRFSGIKDAVPSKFFDAATSAPAPGDANTLIIGLNTGFDPLTFIANDFRASALPFSNRAAMDTISFTIRAPLGFFVSKITYTQHGTGFTSRTSVSYGGAQWVVAGTPLQLGTFTNNPNLSSTVDISRKRLRSVPVTITDSLFATTGSVSITEADVHVELLPIS
jgi:hypothetical protein